jgi:hypothetical protein
MLLLSGHSVAALTCGLGSYRSISEDWMKKCAGCGACLKCPRGYVAHNQALSCDRCSVGKTSNQLHTSCTDCAAGEYGKSEAVIALNTPTVYYSRCLSCPRGKWGRVSGMTSCFACPPGGFNENDRSTHCQKCAPGTFQSKVASSNCIRCPQGYYRSTIQSGARCTACPSGKFQLHSGYVIRYVLLSFAVFCCLYSPEHSPPYTSLVAYSFCCLLGCYKIKLRCSISRTTACRSCPSGGLCTQQFISQAQALSVSSGQDSMRAAAQEQTPRAPWNGHYKVKTDSQHVSIANLEGEIAHLEGDNSAHTVRGRTYSPTAAPLDHPSWQVSASKAKAAGLDVAGQGISNVLMGDLLNAIGKKNTEAHIHGDDTQHFQEHQPHHEFSLPSPLALTPPSPPASILLLPTPPIKSSSSHKVPTRHPTAHAPTAHSPTAHTAKYRVCSPGQFLADPVLCLLCPTGIAFLHTCSFSLYDDMLNLYREISAVRQQQHQLLAM